MNGLQATSCPGAQAEDRSPHAPPIRRILVALDPSSGSAVALHGAVELASRLGAAGTVLLVRRPEADSLDEIVSQAAAARADLVVLDRGSGAGPKAASCELARRILERAGLPVLVVPCFRASRAEKAGFRRIVCGIDFSPGGGDGVGYAAALAAPGARLTLVHVLEGFPDDEVRAAREGSDLGLYWRYREMHAQEGLADLAAERGGRWQAETVVTGGQPWLEILDLASQRDADLIVVESHRDGGHATGGTALRLVAEAACPVLLVPRI